MRILVSVVVMVTIAACAHKPAPAPSTPARPTVEVHSAAELPGQIGVACKATKPGYKDYTTKTLATNPDVCFVGGDGMLTLAVKGEGPDRVALFLAGYRGAGNYPLTGASYLSLSNRIPGAGAAQSTQNCSASRCTATVTDTSAGAPAGTPRELAFAVTCAQVCDMDTHVCTLSPGPVTWTFKSGCRVR